MQRARNDLKLHGTRDIQINDIESSHWHSERNIATKNFFLHKTIRYAQISEDVGIYDRPDLS